MYTILSDEVQNVGLSEDLTNDNLTYFNYATISSVDVKRSVSIYKNLLSSKHRKYTFKNTKTYLIVQCNFQKSHDLLIR